MGKVQMGIEAVLALIIRSIEIDNVPNAKAIAQDALRQLEARPAGTKVLDPLAAGDSQ